MFAINWEAFSFSTRQCSNAFGAPRKLRALLATPVASRNYHVHRHGTAFHSHTHTHARVLRVTGETRQRRRICAVHRPYQIDHRSHGLRSDDDTHIVSECLFVWVLLLLLWWSVVELCVAGVFTVRTECNVRAPDLELGESRTSAHIHTLTHQHSHGQTHRLTRNWLCLYYRDCGGQPSDGHANSYTE